MIPAACPASVTPHGAVRLSKPAWNLIVPTQPAAKEAEQPADDQSASGYDEIMTEFPVAWASG
jgi:hypothetical protein